MPWQERKSIKLHKLDVQLDYSHQTGIWIFFPYTNKEANHYTLTFILY